jgi:phosphoglycolate phosphatase-like HAD superfamily hydrolase
VVRHVVWDWNGTLFDDFRLILASADHACRSVGGPEVDEVLYRARFTRPVRAFYELILEREVDDELWGRIDAAFHEHYHAIMTTGSLAPDALAALATVQLGGRTQSLLSMWHHDRLLPFATELGLAEHLVRIDGLRGVGGGSKLPHLQAHLDALGLSGPDVLIVGDTLDDAHAGEAVGATVVLYAGGEHGPEALARSGLPVATTLMEAIRLGGVAA